MIKLIRTGAIVAFEEINIGSPFFAHDRFWIRTTAHAATALRDTPIPAQGKIVVPDVCNFTIDKCDRTVEAVEVLPL